MEFFSIYPKWPRCSSSSPAQSVSVSTNIQTEENPITFTLGLIFKASATLFDSKGFVRQTKIRSQHPRLIQTCNTAIGLGSQILWLI